MYNYNYLDKEERKVLMRLNKEKKKIMVKEIQMIKNKILNMN